MVPRPRFEGMLALRRAHAARRAIDHRRALVVRLVALRARSELALAPFPGLLECRAVALGIEAPEKFAVAPDAGGDELLADAPEYRPPLFVVRVQQRLAAPAFEPGGELPGQIRRVLQPVVEPVA